MALACVLDASAAVRLILGDPAAAAVAEQIREAAVVLAPELMLTELANTLWKLQKAGHLADLDPQQLLAEARDLVDRVEADRHLQAEALALACHHDHPVYDCLYLALARREAATLISLDRRLQQLAERVLP
ncbi:MULTISPECIES: type II toxin-antitoxin system VapC family toxin [Cyanophyceae]|mgnify:CR=1 FL=1|uniref:Ribonuclease VapC n=1 Tax=Aphanothece cf. minutissima CCALA 015 TaxID=2107695 RepID=A0ABX5F640_9CHRO|nr:MULTISPECIES: type II toxin-antitoxin system VapC family toxin [Cyanophyceae]MCP9796812.1 type II toxin-antitoxin system VapC family toxin [Cyanobium sp. Lug-B]PSB36967.1 VapC toxin family PIN domain ribonuclease [Aphanothece cf. minutissima CCALA 015]